MNIQNKINRIKEVRKDAVEEREIAKANWHVEYNWWDGYINGLDYAIFILEEIATTRKIKKETKKEKRKKK